MAYTTEKKRQFVSLRAQGASYAKISGIMGISKQTLVIWAQQLSREIANQKSIEYEALLESAALTKAARIEALGALFAKVKAELAKRDFSDVPTQRLVEMALSLNKAVREEGAVEMLELVDPKAITLDPAESQSGRFAA